VLYVVPEEFKIKAVGGCRLSAIITVITLKLVAAVFTFCHLLKRISN